LADHSYDHMSHNSDGPKNAYANVENDLRYFGRGNSDPVLHILNSVGYEQNVLDYVNYTMSYFVRLPYSNNWRVSKREGRSIRHDCFACTIPANSGSNGIKITNILHEQMRAQIIGWDLEWNMNFNSNRFGRDETGRFIVHSTNLKLCFRLRYGGDKMFVRLGTGQHTKDKGKVVVLSHDVAFRPHEITGGNSDLAELDALLEKATAAGYEFRTIDTYLDD
jgi:chitin disaccharide deacetylase